MSAYTFIYAIYIFTIDCLLSEAHITSHHMAHILLSFSLSLPSVFVSGARVTTGDPEHTSLWWVSLSHHLTISLALALALAHKWHLNASCETRVLLKQWAVMTWYTRCHRVTREKERKKKNHRAKGRPSEANNLHVKGRFTCDLDT